MRSLIHKGISTVKNDGLQVFGIRIWNYGLMRIKRLLRGENTENVQRWAALKDKYKGQRIFIVGNGPSLNLMPLHLLKNEYTMVFNRFNLMFERLDWHPNFYMVIDDLVVKDMHEQINEEILPIVEYAFFPDIHPSNVEFDKYIDHRENVYWMKADKPEFQADLPNCGLNKTVVNPGIQVAAFLGFSEIYLIGVDMSFSNQKVKKLNSRNWEAEDNDPNHFDPRYFGKGLKYHNPTVHEMIEKFEWCKAFFDKRGVGIYNAGLNSKLDVFPRVEFESLFNLSDGEVVQLLDKSHILEENGLKLQDVIDSALIVKQQELYPNVFRAPLELGASLISKLILDYLPIGPYKGELFFIKRK